MSVECYRCGAVCRGAMGDNPCAGSPGSVNVCTKCIDGYPGTGSTQIWRRISVDYGCIVLTFADLPTDFVEYLKPTQRAPAPDTADISALALIRDGQAWQVAYPKLERLIEAGYVNALGNRLTDAGKKMLVG